MNAHSTRQRRRCTLPTRLLLAAIAAALLMTLIPLGAPVAQARDDENPPRVNPTTTNLTVNPSALRPINDTIVNPTETPEPENPGNLTSVPPVETPEIDDFTTVPPVETPEPIDDFTTAEDEPAAPAVEVFKFVCPLGFDPSITDAMTIEMTCADPMAANFRVFTHFDAVQTDYYGNYLFLSDTAMIGQTDIIEQIPDGFLNPWVFCYDAELGDVIYFDYALAGVIFLQVAEGQYITCTFYNLPEDEETPSGTVELTKWECPDDFVGADWNDYLTNCTVLMNGVEFWASSNGNNLGSKQSGDDGDGKVIWSGLEAGPVAIQETIPAGYLDPVIFCAFTATVYNDAGQAAIIDGFIWPDANLNGLVTHELLENGYLYCDVFNIPTEDYDEYGSITIYKHTCAPGYDVWAPGANPWLDCPSLTNGVTFTLYHGMDVPLQTMTGDSIDGAVYWGGLEPGDYQVQESPPAGTWYAFVYGCQSDVNPGLAPTDLIGLQGGDTLLVDLMPGEDLICHWYNVPKRHGGTVVITKYWCDGHVYSVFVCDLYEDGASFTLDNGWGAVYVTTGWDGKVAINLDAGAYELDEVGFTWCHAEATNVDWQGKIVVEDDQTTYVTVFNCGPRDEPKKPNPGKFPNTGIDPLAALETIAA